MGGGGAAACGGAAGRDGVRPPPRPPPAPPAPPRAGAPPRPPPRPRRRSVADIQDATCEAFGITREDLVSPSRRAQLAWPRQVAMYLARELTDQTLPAIGRAFGGRNHTTVMHACRRTAERMASDPEAYDTVRRLTAELRG